MSVNSFITSCWTNEASGRAPVRLYRLAATLGRIRLGGLITGSDDGSKIKFRLEQMGKDERMIVKALSLDRFISNKA